MAKATPYGILIPTYAGHYEQVKLFLQSYARNCLDKKQAMVSLLVASHEIVLFTELLKGLKADFSLQVISLKDIILSEENVVIDETELLSKIGKFNFQAIKKIYGVKFLNHEACLVLDSEALLIRPFKVKQFFSQYLKSPFVFYSPYFGNPIQETVTYLSCQILKKPALNLWFLESQYWIFEKEIIQGLFAYVQKVSGQTVYQNFCQHLPLFPEIFYYVYLYYHRPTRYRFVNSEELVASHLAFPDYLEYRSSLVENTPLEYIAWGLSLANLKAFTRLFATYKLSLFKYDDRWGKNTTAQQKFVKNNPEIKLLPCRVVTKAFKVGPETVPVNHNLTSNEPILNSFTLLPLLKQRIISLTIVKQTHQFLVTKLDQYQTDKNFELIKSMMKNDSIIKMSKLPKKKTPQLDTSVAFDVGAFVGNSVNRIKSLGYSKIVCFEPSKQNFVKLYHLFGQDPNVSFIYRAASDASDQELTFFSNPFLPWLNTIHADWLHETRHKTAIATVVTSVVKTITLDQMIKNLGIIPAYIKIDTEGHEALVLQGLSFKPTLLSFEWISERETQNLECLKLCRKLGFKKYFVKLRESVPEFGKEKAVTFTQAREYLQQITALDTQNNLGGNIWCQ